MGLGLAQSASYPERIYTVSRKALRQISASRTEQTRFLGCDLVLVCTQAFEVAAVLGSIKPVLTEPQTLAILSNGLGICEEATAIISPQQLVRASVRTGFLRQTDNHIKQTGSLQIEFAGHRAKQCLHAFRQQWAGDFNELPSPILLEWKKVLVNAIVNSLCTLVQEKNSALLNNKQLTLRAEKLFYEIIEVAKSDGIGMPELNFDTFLNGIRNHAENENSTLIAWRTGRLTETDYLLGKVRAIALAHKIEAPEIERTWLELKSFLEQK